MAFDWRQALRYLGFTVKTVAQVKAAKSADEREQVIRDTAKHLKDYRDRRNREREEGGE